MFITVFTPTYNRRYTLPSLYNSLCRQTVKDFEWVIVDDGSTDDTKALIDSWIEENIITIRYFLQANSGKPMAHNKGVLEAAGEMFVCVDSDDYLRSDAVEVLKNNWDVNSGFIGMLACRQRIDGTPITKFDDRIISSQLGRAYRQHLLSGDTMLIYKTDIIRKYKFPFIEGEKFIPEGYLYNKLDQEGELLFLKEYLYICEYLEDGYTKNVDKLIYNNYKSYLLHINERIKLEDSLYYKFFDSVRYDSVMIAHKQKGIIKNAINPVLAAIGLPLGLVIAIKRYSRFW